MKEVILVHGLWRTPLSLTWLARTLRKAQFRPRFFGYCPAVESLPHIVHRLVGRLRRIANRGEEVGLVGHSLGGILLRLAIPHVCHLRVRMLTMMGSPNRGSVVARQASSWRLFRWLSRSCGELLASPEMERRLPKPTTPYTLLAGTAGPQELRFPFGGEVNDGIVALSEVRIHDTDEPHCFPVWHTFIMNDPAVHQAVVASLQPNGGAVRESRGQERNASSSIG